MVNWFMRQVWQRSDERELLVRTLAALVKELGGSAVISMAQLEDVDLNVVDISKNDDPDGIRIFVKDCV